MSDETIAFLILMLHNLEEVSKNGPEEHHRIGGRCPYPGASI